MRFSQLRFRESRPEGRAGAEPGLDTVRRLAAAALLARHWPEQGSRQSAAMALSGGLLRAGWETEDVAHFVGAVATAAGDEEGAMRATTAGYTNRRVRDKQSATGWPTLSELLGDKVVQRACEWLRVKQHDTRIESQAPATASFEDFESEEPDRRPTIQVNNRYMREITSVSLMALNNLGDMGPSLFMRGTKLARLTSNVGGAFAEILSPDALRGILDRAADRTIRLLAY